jgi:predicted GTPase
VVVAATPVDLAHLVRVGKPVIRARYEFAETGEPQLSTLVDAFLDRIAARGTGRRQETAEDGSERFKSD